MFANHSLASQSGVFVVKDLAGLDFKHFASLSGINVSHSTVMLAFQWFPQLFLGHQSHATFELSEDALVGLRVNVYLVS